MMDTQPTPSHGFTLRTGQQQRHLPGRDAAVSEAKRISRDHPGGVEVERDDGQEWMRFRDGRLIDFVYGPAPRPSDAGSHDSRDKSAES